MFCFCNVFGVLVKFGVVVSISAQGLTTTVSVLLFKGVTHEQAEHKSRVQSVSHSRPKTLSLVHANHVSASVVLVYIKIGYTRPAKSKAVTKEGALNEAVCDH